MTTTTTPALDTNIAMMAHFMRKDGNFYSRHDGFDDGTERYAELFTDERRQKYNPLQMFPSAPALTDAISWLSVDMAYALRHPADNFHCVRFMGDCETGHYADVVEQVINTGYDAVFAFYEAMRHLNYYGGADVIASLGYDFAPWSFAFTYKFKGGGGSIHGGLIYSGPGHDDSGPMVSDGSYPSLTVSIGEPVQGHNWRTHT